MSSAESKVYPTVAGRGGRVGRGAGGGGGRGTAATEPATATGPLVPFQRPVALYLPPNHVPGTETPFIVVMDGTSWYVKSEAPNARQDLAFIPTMLDNLIHEKRVPPMVAIMVNPGQNRSLEYDTVSDRYTQFVEGELLPKIAKEYNVNFTKDPEGRAAFGESSGSACAMAMAWFHSELYRRVISHSGTFVGLRRDPEAAPHGAWEYHENFIPKSDVKPIRIWLQVGENDNGSRSPEAGMNNWVLANAHMADALKAWGYPYQFVYWVGVGHVSRPVQRQTMPEAFEWAWQGYKAK
jgi:enterochelin esterase-like enzyme